MSNENVTELKTEAQQVADIKAKLAQHLAGACFEMNRAKKLGITVAFGVNMDQLGEYVVTSTAFTKLL